MYRPGDPIPRAMNIYERAAVDAKGNTGIPRHIRKEHTRTSFNNGASYSTSQIGDRAVKSFERAGDLSPEEMEIRYEG